MCAKNTKINRDSSESRVESLYALILDLLRSRDGSVLFGDDSDYGARAPQQRQTELWAEG